MRITIQAIAIALTLMCTCFSVNGIDNVLARIRDRKLSTANKSTFRGCASEAPGRPYLDCLYAGGMEKVAGNAYYKDMIGLFAMKAREEKRPFYLVHCLSSNYLKSACTKGLMPSQYVGGTTSTNADDITKGLGKYLFTRLVVGQNGANAKFQSLMSYKLDAGKTCFYIDGVQLFYRPFYSYIGDSGKTVKSDSLAQSPYRALTGEVSMTEYVETNVQVMDDIMSKTRANNEVVILGPASPMFLLGMDTTASKAEVPQECKTLFANKYIGYDQSVGDRMASLPLLPSGLDQLADYVNDKLRSVAGLPDPKKVAKSTAADEAGPSSSAAATPGSPGKK